MKDDERPWGMHRNTVKKLSLNGQGTDCIALDTCTSQNAKVGQGYKEYQISGFSFSRGLTIL